MTTSQIYYCLVRHEKTIKRFCDLLSFEIFCLTVTACLGPYAKTTMTAMAQLAWQFHIVASYYHCRKLLPKHRNKLPITKFTTKYSRCLTLRMRFDCKQGGLYLYFLEACTYNKHEEQIATEARSRGAVMLPEIVTLTSWWQVIFSIFSRSARCDKWRRWMDVRDSKYCHLSLLLENRVHVVGSLH